MSARCALRRAGALPRFRSSYAARSLHLQPAAPCELPCARRRGRNSFGSSPGSVRPGTANTRLRARPKADEKTPWKLVQVWALEADPAGTLWAGTVPGGLFRSSDRGASWALVESLWRRPERAEWLGGGYDHPGIHSICIDPRDSRRITLGISCGGAWQTRDGGETWNIASHGMYAEFMPPERRNDPNIQDPHRIVQCASRPDVFWAQHHNGVFRSTDGSSRD